MAFVVGIGFVTVISWFRNTAVTYFPDDDAGDARFEYFKQIVSIEKFDKTLAPFTGDLSSVGVALVTFLYVDFLDTSVSFLFVEFLFLRRLVKSTSIPSVPFYDPALIPFLSNIFPSMLLSGYFVCFG